MDIRSAPNSRDKDLISKLPNEIILHILSYLDILQVVRTSKLSKRWRYLWKLVPIIRFTYEISSRYPKEENFSEFIDLVNRVLLCRDDSDLREFILVAPKNYPNPDLVMGSIKTWVYGLIRRKIQQISMDLNTTWLLDFALPDDLFHCKSMTKLELVMTDLEMAELKFPDSMSLPQLKYLSLRSFTLDKNMDSMNQLISSCPVLETLILACIEIYVKGDHENIIINAPLLEHIQIRNIWYRKQAIGSFNPPMPIHLSAPKLKTFVCQDFMFRENFTFVGDLSSLVTVDVTMVLDASYSTYFADEHDDKVDEYRESYANLSVAERKKFAVRIMKFLKPFHNARVLKLSPGILEVISGVPELVVLGELPQFCNLRRLKLQLWLTRGCFCALQVLSTIAPNLESLHLSIQSSTLLDKVEDWDAAELSFPTMLQQLKLIEVRGVERSSNELMLLESFLRNAVVLKELVVFTREVDFEDNQDNQIKDFNERLLGCPRAAPNVRISIADEISSLS